MSINETCRLQTLHEGPHDAIKEYLAEFIEKNAVLAPQGATADGPKNEIWRTAETLASHSTPSSCDLAGAGRKLKSNAG